MPAADAVPTVWESIGKGRFALAEYAVFCGLDVGKSAHHACALSVDGRSLFDSELPQDEVRLAKLFSELSEQGPVLVIVDQPNTIGALPIAVARDCGVEVAYLPGLVMRRVADLHPGSAKTDARDAYVIADAARTMPHLLRRVDLGSSALADLGVLVGYDDDLAQEATRLSNRIRGLLSQVHPALERVLGPRLGQKAALGLLVTFGGPQGMAKAKPAGLLREARKANTRAPEELVDQVWAALNQQTVTVAGTNAAQTVLSQLAASLAATLAQRAQIAAEIEKALDAHPLSEVLTSMPGIGVRTAATILLTCGDCSQFPSAGHLASYAGIAPVTRKSGTSINGEHPSRHGNRQLKRALYLSAFAALRDPLNRAYYDRKRAQGKTHQAALICLARRRCDVLYAMITKHQTYQTDRHAQQAA